MALRNKSLSPTCAPDLGDIGTYFFLKKYFDLISEYAIQWRHFWCSDVTGAKVSVRKKMANLMTPP